MVLRKDATHWLAAFGTFAEGFSLSYQDGDSNYQFYAEQQGTPVAEVVRIFQAYARGEDWGQARFTWEPFILRDKTMTIVKRLLMIILLGYTAWAVIKLATR